MMAYHELSTTTNFSFLEGASHPQELIQQAHHLGLGGIGIADRNSLAGVVRAYSAHSELVERTGSPLKLFIGCRLVFTDETPDLIVYPRHRSAYGQLCRLLSEGRERAKIKGECHLLFEDFKFRARNFQIIVLPSAHTEGRLLHFLRQLRRIAPSCIWLGLAMPHHGADKRRAEALARIAAASNVPLLAHNDVLYHSPARRPLQDVLTCIREQVTIETIGRRLEKNAERHLRAPDEMQRLFRYFPAALDETQRFIEPISFSMAELKYNYPDEPVPKGKTPQQHLRDETWKGAARRYPQGIPDKVRKLLEKELRLIEQLKYEPYFLTVYDIVQYARSQGILCQGRGSSANSAVCYCLGITAVDPSKSEVLFERFLSIERKEPPDIDVDFEHERREEVMQWIFERYTRKRAAIIATVICYRPRSAIRDVGKALGLTEDVTGALANMVWGSWGKTIEHEEIRQAGLDPDNGMIRRAIKLTRALIGFPRHLSQHVGGYVLTRDRLDEMVPIGPAAMKDRTFIEWDKDDIDELNIMKVDVLALGMLTCIRKAFEFIRQTKGEHWELATIPPDDQKVYAMLCRADSIGVFQVESRAQMNMLPRLRPQEFYDLVIEVAIVRPGPIQGDMVHPYLRRRKGIEKVHYPSPSPRYGPADELENVLGRTLGVPLFQEQAMRIAIVAAGFSADDANKLRRSMATFRHMGTIHEMEERMVEGMVGRGYDRTFAQNCFNQIKGFGEYGFPESHAASFAILVYVSAWIKCHHPEIFAAALLNSQPMGFYAPAQIIRDVREHGVEVRPVDINFSEWDNTIERIDADKLALRLGFRQVEGFSKNWAKRICEIRQKPFSDMEQVRRLTRLERRAFVLLADADAFRSIAMDRRAALWAVRRFPDNETLPLFLAADTNELAAEAETRLPDMRFSEHVVADYESTRFSLKGHPMQFLREMFAKAGVLSCRDATALPNNRRVKLAGIITVRQRPGSAKGVVFMTIEDETGIANIVIWEKLLQKQRREVMGSRLIMIEGVVQSADNVVHIVANRLHDKTAELHRLSEQRAHLPVSRSDEPTHSSQMESRGRHPRNERMLPKSRDFH
ncbi:error-prone DNA polymerase [Phyllobacterium sp. 0TCS1.6C]|uniref:error-prone DNA polymerase n=1 Tax=unclassified Phyllobacterium TaxID=2638441 RepID=UPI0022644FE4|nr:MULTISPECIES: error-prone DNA polymerase [unclassified Phyllobacterium]MCX8282222.1 error-prone DNA polymerase [Phyllobacterium sp. 0TCS1.6C]MCX8294910.1 error-prone DNA polymerase [Phyllobacterium sp. 0TCS1.6A]